MPAGLAWCRRARPVLGTLVEVGVGVAGGGEQGSEHGALAAAWQALALVQARMSAFEPDSDLGRSHAAAVGAPIRLHPWTAEVLRLAARLHTQTEGRFDVACGTGRWQLVGRDDLDGIDLVRLDATTRLDLGGIAKGFAVDQAVAAALAAGAQAAWVNAGGDLRVQGASLPVSLRDEAGGGVRPWLELADGALATSDFSPGARARLHAPVAASLAPGRHLSVAAPTCMVADALTKVVASLGEVDHPMALDLLRHYGAQAWVHSPPVSSPP